VKKSSILIGIALACVLSGALAHDWLSLAWNAWGYPQAAPSARTQIVVARGHAFIAAGIEGIEVIDLAQGKRVALLSPRAPLDRIDDLAVADGWLFALDATPPGFLQVFALDSTGLRGPFGAATPVAVGPFSGVAAAAGRVVVSGGTSLLSLHEFDADGRLGGGAAEADFGRGQPDIALRADGRLAVISTHLYGPEFGLTFVAIERSPLRLHELGRMRLGNAGFTRGGYKPAHFPMVAAWQGDRVYLADGGGLTVIDASDPRHPRLLSQDRRAQPAMDLAVAGNTLVVAVAGDTPSLLRYRLVRSGMPALVSNWRLPAHTRPAAIAIDGDNSLIALHERGWRSVPFNAFATVPTQ
jgi:hypothetical protein